MWNYMFLHPYSIYMSFSRREGHITACNRLHCNNGTEECGIYCSFSSIEGTEEYEVHYSIPCMEEFFRGGGEMSMKCEVQAQLLTCFRPDSQTLNLVKVNKRERWEIKTRKKEGEKRQWLREELKPVNWQMVYYAPTNWATESLPSQKSMGYTRYTIQSLCRGTGFLNNVLLYRTETAEWWRLSWSSCWTC